MSSFLISPLQARSLMALTILPSVLNCEVITSLLVVAICRNCVTLNLLPIPTVTNVTPALLKWRDGAMTESSDLLPVITMATFRLVERENNEMAENLNAVPSLALPFMNGIRPITFINVAWLVKRLKSNSFLGLVLYSTIPNRVTLEETENEATMCFKKFRSRWKLMPRMFDDASTIKPMSRGREHTVREAFVVYS